MAKTEQFAGLLRTWTKRNNLAGGFVPFCLEGPGDAANLLNIVPKQQPNKDCGVNLFLANKASGVNLCIVNKASGDTGPSMQRQKHAGSIPRGPRPN